MEGKRRVPEEIAQEMAGHADDDELTPRETQVLTHVARGEANRDVATALGIAEETVKAHMKSILAKLQANDRRMRWPSPCAGASSNSEPGCPIAINERGVKPARGRDACGIRPG